MYNYFNVAYNLLAMQRRAYWSEAKLTDYQNRRVREVIRNAYDNVPYYRRLMKRLEVNPSDIKTIKDLNRLPILTKNDIAANVHDMISEKFTLSELKTVSTSGSTGRPLSTYLSKRDDEFRKAKHLRANISLGQKPLDTWIVITAPQHFSDVTRLQRFLHIYAANPLSVFDDPKTQASTLQRMKPDVLDGYSSSIFLLANEIEKNGEGVTPRFVIGGAELADNSSRQAIERAFGVPFYDQYACVELERVAWQCKEKSGYHVDADSLIMQFMDENGDEVARGERGEIVCTSLFNQAMPFIRYAVGDVGKLSEESGCPCGRTLPLMKVIEGRKDSIIVLPNHQKLAPLVIGDGMMFFKYFNDIEQYRVIQKKTSFFKIIVKRKGHEISDEEFETELISHFLKLLKVEKDSLTVEVEFVDEILVEPTGKLRKVISELDSDKRNSSR
jgi:phenylacetate-CoA ligase